MLTITGAYLGFMIGTGVATGQEILQYYTANGWMIFGTAVVICIIFIVANYGFALAGKRMRVSKGRGAFVYYLGRHVGWGVELFVVLFCYLSYAVMVAGGAATLHQELGMPTYVGAGIVAALAGFSVALGLGKLVDIIGRITPLLLFCIVAMVLYHLLQHIDMLSANAALIESGEITMTRVGDNWWMAGLSNGGYSILMLAAFSAVLGSREDFKTLFCANVLSTLLLVGMNTLIGLSIMSRIGDLYNVQIPNLLIVGSIAPGLTTLFGVLIFVAVYTTACPLLWTAVQRFSADGTPQYRVLALVLAAVGFFFGLFVPYSTILNVVYGLNGYIGFLVMAVVTLRLIRDRFFPNVLPQFAFGYETEKELFAEEEVCQK